MRLKPLLAFALAATALAPAGAARPVRFAADLPRTGMLVLPLANENGLGALDAETRASVLRALQAAKFDYAERSTLTLRGVGPWSKLVVVGTGADAPTSLELQEIGGTAAVEAKGEDGPVAILASGLQDAAQVAAGVDLGGYSFDKYKYVDPAAIQPAGLNDPVTVVTQDRAAEARYRRSGRALADGVNLTRDLINEPANTIYPETFVARTREAFSGVGGVKIDVLDVPAMERLGMGSILSVGKGSARPPRMLIVEYRGQGAPARPIVMAGKGITFDSGGISLKPGNGMWEMKGDMSGAAAVVGAVLALAKDGAPVNVVAIAALAENMPGGGATRPGDVVKAHNGKTIEILNTDAEGRLVLADAVAYADTRYDPAAIVDLATLTGAKVTALGDEYAALFSRHDALADQLATAGETTGELLWRMPLHPNHAKDMNSDIADIKNVVEGGQPGASFGAHFIGYFADPATPWAHLDIAGNEMGSGNGPIVPEGAAGYGVRLLDRFARDFREIPAGEAGQ